MDVSREQALAWRVHAQQLQHPGQGLTEPAILDLGVQGTGSDGAGWALANRGVPLDDLAAMPDHLVLAWTLRGAPHFYRRAEVAQVAAATWPRSDADAAKRIFDASKPLREAGIGALEALETVASHQRAVVTRPTVKGDLSTALTARLDQPYLRWCVPCQATHAYEQTFRLAALRAGLELEAGTSPPVLRRIRGWRRPASSHDDRLDPVRAYLHLLGPATPKQVAAYVDSPVREVKEHWPADAVEVDVAGERRWLLPDDASAIADVEVDPSAVRLLGSHDLLLQGRDRELMVPDPGLRKRLWVTLGRPGAVLRGAEIVGTWRPRAKGRRLRLEVEADVPAAALAEQAERLAAYRGAELAGVDPG